MTPKQKKEVLKIVKNDCKIRCRYIDENGLTCAVGALAQSAGVTDKSLEKAGGKYISLLPRMVSKIRLKFGIGASQLMEIQKKNDGPYARRLRVAAITRFIKSL